MEQSSGRHAWLYQYKPSRDAEWLRRLRTDRAVDWRISRWSSNTSVGDLVLFWESGKAGGLRGYGAVNGDLRSETLPNGRRIWRVPVRVMFWMASVVPRQQVIDQRSFLEGNLYLSMTQGANFPLEPEEVTSLLSLMPVEAEVASLSDVSHHPPGVPSALQRFAGSALDPADVDEPFSGDEGVSPTNAKGQARFRSDGSDLRLTPATAWIVGQADYRKRKIAGPLSTTRLLLAALNLDAWPEGVALSTHESVAVAALSRVSREFKGPIESLRQRYLEEQSPGSAKGGLETTENVDRVFERARGLASQEELQDGLALHLLAAALLTLDEGVVLDRLKGVGLSLADLQQSLLRSVSDTSPHLASFWEKTLGAQGGVDMLEQASRTSVAVVGNDNAWSTGQKDSLGVEREALAFAALTLSRHFVPPLAVGVFGDWGAGKSFFLRLVHEHIQRLSEEASKAAGPKELLSDVVQIRFNAWHYMDTNLWASLVDHIFTELDNATNKSSRASSEALFEQLTTARQLTIESAERLIQRRREQDIAARTVAEAERKLLTKKASLGTSPDIYWSAVKAHFGALLDEKEEGKLKKAAEQLGIPGLIEDGKALSDAVHQMEEQRGRAKLIATGLRSQLGSWWIAAAFVGVCLGVGSLLSGLNFLSSLVLKNEDFRQIWSQSLITTSSLVAALASVFTIASGRVKKGLDSLQSFRDKFDDAAKRALEEPSAAVKKEQDELARLAAEVAEGRARLALSTEKLSEAARDYNAGTGRGRLLSFVRARAANKDYAKHLGLVASIRKDFEELSDLIASATSSERTEQEASLAHERAAYKLRVEALLESAKSGEDDLLTLEEKEKLRASIRGEDAENLPPLNRIVLYIDDLDRCQPETVAEVLQAVHLLLSFKLFVVYVAVDVRWVARALRTNYPTLLLRSEESSNGAAAATAHDYLEKIFQIPYWVRDMTAESSRKFVADRLSYQSSTLAHFEARSSADEREDGSLELGNDGSPADIVLDADAFDDLNINDVKRKKISLTPRLEVPHVRLSELEEEFMVELARWAGDSPRRLLRFMNVYQVLKASLPPEEAESLNSGKFHGLMALVAIATANSQAHEELFATSEILNRYEKLSELVADLRSRIDSPSDANSSNQRIFGILSALLARSPSATLEGLNASAMLTKRFSFWNAG